jgi:hypothetical protein
MSFMPLSLHWLLSSCTAVSSCVLYVLHFAMAYFNAPCPAVSLLHLSVRPVLWPCQGMQMIFLHALFIDVYLPTALCLFSLPGIACADQACNLSKAYAQPVHLLCAWQVWYRAS